ncbi:MAG: hypothetical protein V4747_12320 [Pseudomonadota bacterium]
MTGFDDAAARTALLERLGQENAALSERLARLEYEAMMLELRSGAAFSVRLRFGARRAAASPAVASASALLAAETSGLAPIFVPLGKTAWVPNPARLPVFGVALVDQGEQALAETLLPLLAEHHRRPFCRFVFLLDSFRAVPFLGRYGFAMHRLDGRALADQIAPLAARFGLAEVRSGVGAQLLWKRG